MLSTFKNIVRLMRPEQWVKNMFIFLPLFFDQHLADMGRFVACLVAFAGFSLVASSIYCINDIADVDVDRKHPTKKNRPVASGAVSSGMAKAMAALLLLGGVALIFFAGLDVRVLAIVLAYYVMNIAYTFYLKNFAILDVVIIALGFVLRVVAGGFAAQVELSHWIVLMTFLLALFLGFAKRRDDVVIYEQKGVKARGNVARYNSEFLGAVMMITATITVVCYIMYTVDPQVTARFGSKHIYATSIFVIAGIFRYLQLSMVDQQSGNPTKALLRDRFIQLCIAGWIVAFALLIYIF